MDSILVTGSNGFIGRKIIERLPKSKVLTDSINSSRVNLENISDVLKIEPSEVVIHLGGKTPKQNLTKRDYFNNNILSTINILEYCVVKKVKKLIYVSSYIYGNPEYIPINEKHPINPHNAYSESKFLGERLCKFYCDKTDLDVIILRPFNIYGESMNQGFFLSNLINSIKTDKKISIINKESKRDFLYIDDFVDLILKIIDYECKFEIFNVGTGISFSFEDIIKKIENFTSKIVNLEYSQNKEVFIADICADISKIQKKINWEPKIEFDEGLRRMLRE